MKYVRGVLVWCVVSGVAWGSPADFSAPVVAKQFQPVKKSAAVVSNKSSPSVPRNVIPITTLNSNESNETGVPRHEPCAAIRLTPTLLLTAAHCLVGGLTHGSRVYAGLFKAQDDTQGLLFSDSRKANLFQPNAQVFLYRPHWNENHPAATPLDFAVVVLDRKLKFNSKFTKKITNLL